MNPVLGNYHELARWHESRCRRPLSFLDERWQDPDTWRAQARGTVLSLLSYEPPATPLDARVEAHAETNGLVTEPFGPRTEAFVIYPAGVGGAGGPPAHNLPGIVALHDHSGFYWFGKEKITAVPGEPPLLTELKALEYGGVSWTNEVARRGYVVIVPDVFLWGSRRIDPAAVSAALTTELIKQTPGTPEYIEAYNAFMSGYETNIAKTLFLSGTTWPGIMAWEDRRALDYLLTRPEVDPARVGCGGLSGGGLRTIYLAALDPRVRCAACAGFMSTLDEMLEEKVRHHTWMFHVPHLAELMDLPDVASLHGPLPLMVLNDRDDPLWTLAGEEKADRTLRAVYESRRPRPLLADLGAGSRYRGMFYPGPHKFDVPMQKDAFDWFDRWLK